MRILIFILLSFFSYAQKVTVYQINADWNAQNTVKIKLKNCKYIYADIDQLSLAIKRQIKSIPAILIYKEGRNRRQYMAGIDMKLNIKEEELQNFIDTLNDEEL